MMIKKTFSLSIFFILVLLQFSCKVQQSLLTNPVLESGADPWSIYRKGYYYYTQTMGDRLVIWKTKSMASLQKAEKKTIFQPPAGTAWSKGLWAPEIHFIRGKWYMYFAADNGKNETHRLYVLENSSSDPMKGEWIFRGKLNDSTDKWAIDGSVFEYQDNLYLVWSGWEGDSNGRQDIYISKMKDPLTLSGNRVRISSPVYDWETHGDLHDPDNPPHVSVNEGPQFLEKNGKVFLIYSASGCWTEYYALGMLSNTGGNLMDSASWKKSTEPVFKKSIENGVYAPGHNSFFKSPNGKEDWILYHANSAPNQGCGRKRSPRAQKFSWNADGTPNFGEPVKTGIALPGPSKTKRKK